MIHTSGSSDIDSLREEMKTAPTTPANLQERLLLLHLWLGALQQQGADVRPFYELNTALLTLQLQVDRARGKRKRELLGRLCLLLDQSLPVLEDIQTGLNEDGPWFDPFENREDIVADTEGLDIEWPTFQGNIHNTGYTDGPAPQRGKCVWKFPVGLGWYARPVIEGDRVYCTSPGMDTIAFCLDLHDGSEVWRAHQRHPLFGVYKYPGLASTPVVQDNAIVIRELNSHGGDRGQAKHIVFIDKQTGHVIQRRYVGHVDYRARYAPVAGNNDILVYPFAVQDIYACPPVLQNFNRLICKDKNADELLWDFNAGDIDILAQATVTDSLVLQGTEDGYLYAICLPAHPRYKRNHRGVIAWKYHVGLPINTTVTVHGDSVVFGANDGAVHCLKLETGKCTWRSTVGNLEPRARKLFSTPLIRDGRIYIGSADRHLYCLDLNDGNIHWSAETFDWIRAQPAIVRDRVFAAGHDGHLHAISTHGETLWQKRISTHPIYADLAAAGNRILISDSNLMLFCLDADGGEIWKHSILPAFSDKHGQRIFTDQLAGGTYYQSKPVGYRGKVIFGTPSGFLLAVNPDSGEEIWKFEMGAAISVGAACAHGRIFAGQQGGEPHFYCLDAETGAPIWKQTIPGGWVWGSAKVDHGKIYIPTVSGYAMCLDAETGNIIWMYRTAKSIPAEPAIDDKHVYFGSWSQSLYAFCKNTGKLIWKTNGVGLDSGTLIALDGKVYVPNHQNVFTSIDSATGNVICPGNLNADEKMNASNFNATPAFHNGFGFFSARVGVGLVGVPLTSRVYCIDQETAEIKWTFPDGGGLSAPAIARGKVYIASGNCPYLYCLDEATGEARWIYKLGHRVEESTLCIYRGNVYALAADGYVHAVE